MDRAFIKLRMYCTARPRFLPSHAYPINLQSSKQYYYVENNNYKL